MAEASESWVSARGVGDSASIMELTSGAHEQVFLDLLSPCQLLIVRRDCNALLLCHFEALIPLALLQLSKVDGCLFFLSEYRLHLLRIQFLLKVDCLEEFHVCEAVVLVLSDELALHALNVISLLLQR